MGALTLQGTVDLRDPEAVRAAVTDPDRLAELRDSGLLDSGAEETFDRITRLAERVLDVPVALLSMVDRDRQYFKSEVGLPLDLADSRETPLSHSFCQYAVASRSRFVVDDARSHPLVHDHPALRELDVVAYAGQPLETSSGHVLGALCVIQREPRHWTAEELDTLGDLAALALTEIEYRLRIKALQNLAGVVRELEGPVESLSDAVRRLTDRAERVEDPVVARLATAACARLDAVERATDALLETRRWSEHAVDGVHRPAMIEDRLMQAAKVATASVPDGSLRTQVRDRPLVVRCDPYAFERALTNLLVGAMQHAVAGHAVEVTLHRAGGKVVLDLDSEGRPMPRAELTRLVAQLAEAITDAGTPTTAALQTSGRTTRIDHGPVSATTGLAGTYLSLRVPLVVR